MRVASISASRAAGGGLRTGEAEAALPRREERQRLVERCLVEVGPQRIGEVELGVREIPP